MWTKAENKVYMRRIRSRIQVVVPYNPDFVVEAHKLEGRWKKRSGMWSFNASQYPTLALVLNALFNTDFKTETPE